MKLVATRKKGSDRGEARGALTQERAAAGFTAALMEGSELG